MLLLGDCNHWLKEIKDESIDLICTDPPYGIEFMGKDWDKALVPTETWKECYRVLKEGKLAFVMCSPRQDVLSRMIVNLQDAGFRTNYTSIYWTYASGFPKAANISKLIDKKNGRYFDTSVKDYLNQKRKEKGLSFYDINKYLDAATNGGGIASALMGDKPNNELPTVANYNKLKTLLDLDNRFDDLIEREEADREITGYDKYKKGWSSEGSNEGWKAEAHKKYDKRAFTKPATEEAKKMEGAYVGFQPKPAVEVILVVSKGKTLTWLDDCRIPYSIPPEEEPGYRSNYKNYNLNTYKYEKWSGDKKTRPLQKDQYDEKGRFPANLLVSSNILDNGENYSRYFSLDAWAKTFPFLIVPKASASERNKGCESLPEQFAPKGNNIGRDMDNPKNHLGGMQSSKMHNNHPTVKPLKLMSYLITMGSREGDLVLDPFCGSGTVCIAAHQLHRKWLGIEMNPEYAEIIKKRLADPLAQLKLSAFA